METLFSANSAQKFTCNNCHVFCSKKNDWDRHLTTSKHKRNCGMEMEQKKIPENFTCKCGKIYSTKSGLWKHNKTCKFETTAFEQEAHTEQNIFLKVFDKAPNDLNILTNLVLEVIKNNSELQKQTNELFKQNGEFQKQTNELQKQMFEVCKNGKVTNSTINSHNNNKTFNLQFFLNEQCKDAMNIMDFVNTFQLQLSDFERIGEVGYVEGISTIVMDKLNQMDVYKRPIHCSDAKRETMHVKDNGVWTKDTTANDKIRLALKHITKKNTDMIRPWLNAHPGVLNSEHKLNDKYQEMFIEAMGGRKNKNIKEGEDKIIKKISKMVLIDKSSVGRHP